MLSEQDLDKIRREMAARFIIGATLLPVSPGAYEIVINKKTDRPSMGAARLIHSTVLLSAADCLAMNRAFFSSLEFPRSER